MLPRTYFMMGPRFSWECFTLQLNRSLAWADGSAELYNVMHSKTSRVCRVCPLAPERDIHADEQVSWSSALWHCMPRNNVFLVEAQVDGSVVDVTRCESLHGSAVRPYDRANGVIGHWQGKPWAPTGLRSSMIWPLKWPKIEDEPRPCQQKRYSEPSSGKIRGFWSAMPF